MTINYARESVIDFTKPFMNLGISIMFKVTGPTLLLEQLLGYYIDKKPKFWQKIVLLITNFQYYHRLLIYYIYIDIIRICYLIHPVLCVNPISYGGGVNFTPPAEKPK